MRYPFADFFNDSGELMTQCHRIRSPRNLMWLLWDKNGAGSILMKIYADLHLRSLNQCWSDLPLPHIPTKAGRNYISNTSVKSVAEVESDVP